MSRGEGVATRRTGRSEALVIVASSLGTVFEWYDFFLYGLLATYISAQFFSGVNETTGFILALGAFAAGFAVRPFGALVFGRIGDLVGRKNTFLVTMGIMGLSTFAVGLLPAYATIGVAAPLLLVALRLMQGLALGGEYGGAATYVAEHAPPGRRGFHTSFIQATATLGLFAALLIVIGLRTTLGEAAFAAWGWRLPFLISILLLGISTWIRLQLAESPTFQRMKAEGRSSRSPLRDSFARWGNLRIVLVALFGAAMGQAVTFYTAQFYALFFLEKTLKVDGATTNLLMAAALALATPFYILFGWLSDRIGRRPVMLAGLALAAVSYFPAFQLLTDAANPALAAAQRGWPVTVTTTLETCSIQFDPIGSNRFDASGCDIAKAYLAKAGIPYAARSDDGSERGTIVTIGRESFAAPDPHAVRPADRAAATTAFHARLTAALDRAGYPPRADPAAMNRPAIVAILFYLVLIGTAVYGPIAAMLVELFPTNIRYTSMSLPYHIGNGWFGGFLPTTAFAIVAATGNIYDGLWYPVTIAAITLVVGALFLPETYRRDIEA